MAGFRSESAPGNDGDDEQEHKKEADPSYSLNADDYYAFYWATLHLKIELIHCRSNFRPIGSCAPIIAVVKSTIVSLAKLRTAFGINALALFPEDTALAHTLRGHALKAKSLNYLNDVPITMLEFASDLKSMDAAFHNYDKIFSDEKFSTLIILLTTMLEEEATIIEKRLFLNFDANDKRKKEEIQHYLHSLLSHLTGRLLDLEHLLKNFISQGLPVIRSTQQDRDSRYLTMTTIATFFSAVTATVLQMSYQDNTSSTAIATNALLLSSIVFSIASAVSSLLTMAWHGSVVRQTEQILPGWADAWLKKWPIVSLLISGSLFFGALCCFVISSNQHLVSRLLTYTFVSINAIALISLTIWLTFEEWKVRRLPNGAGRDLTDSSLTLDVIDRLESTIRSASFGGKKTVESKGTGTGHANAILSFNSYGYRPDYGHGHEQTSPGPATYMRGQDRASGGDGIVVNPWIPPLRRAVSTHTPVAPGAVLLENFSPPGENSIPSATESVPGLPQLKHTIRPFMSETANTLPHPYTLPGVNPIPGVTEWLRPDFQNTTGNSYISPQNNLTPYDSGRPRNSRITHRS